MSLSLPHARTILKKTAVLGRQGGSPSFKGIKPNTRDNRHLKFLFLGCEEGCEYGPYDHTATLFLDLICCALESLSIKKNVDPDGGNSTSETQFTVSITVYRASQGDMPGATFDWDRFDGFILPGSYDAAYDEKNRPWIKELRELIQKELVAKCRPTLGVCFGHQILAHSYQNHGSGTANVDSGGRAAKCPAGKQVGRKTFQLTNVGRMILHALGPSSDQNVEQFTKKRKYACDDDKDKAQGYCGNEGNNEMDDTSRSDTTRSVDLYYTHGDMVERLPKHAVSIGGNDNVPIQAAAYFATEQDAMEFTTMADHTTDSVDIARNIIEAKVKPFAITFQAHPEYASSQSLGLERTLGNIIAGMESRKDITRAQKEFVQRDAKLHYESVEQQSIQLMVSVGQWLGWFPLMP